MDSANSVLIEVEAFENYGGWDHPFNLPKFIEAIELKIEHNHHKEFRVV